MYQNAIYICISWYGKIGGFPVKKYWYQLNSRGVSRDSYIFWIFFRQVITVSSFNMVGYVWQILGRGVFFSHPIREQPWKIPIREQPRKSPSWIRLKFLTLKKGLSHFLTTFKVMLKKKFVTFLRLFKFLILKEDTITVLKFLIPKKDSVTFLWLLKLLILKKVCITFLWLLKFLILKKDSITSLRLL